MDNSYKINDKVVEAVSKPAIKNTNAVWKEKVEQISTFVREVKKRTCVTSKFFVVFKDFM